MWNMEREPGTLSPSCVQSLTPLSLSSLCPAVFLSLNFTFPFISLSSAFAPCSLFLSVPQIFSILFIADITEKNPHRSSSVNSVMFRVELCIYGALSEAEEEDSCPSGLWNDSHNLLRKIIIIVKLLI